jgi:hypothetical protein
LPHAFEVDELKEVRASAAIYIVTDALERTVYVGSVCRAGRSGAVALRVREHRRNPIKRLIWHAVWVLPLVDETPVHVVRRIEGAVGADLTPRLNRRLPAI